MRAVRDEDVTGLHGAHVASDVCELSIVVAAELEPTSGLLIPKFPSRYRTYRSLRICCRAAFNDRSYYAKARWHIGSTWRAGRYRERDRKEIGQS